MAYKQFYIQDKTKVGKSFAEKMRKVGYNPVEDWKLMDDAKMIVYDINNTAVLFETDGDKGLAKGGYGNLQMIGELENITKTEKEIKQKTRFKLEEIK